MVMDATEVADNGAIVCWQQQTALTNADYIVGCANRAIAIALEKVTRE